MRNLVESPAGAIASATAARAASLYRDALDMLHTGRGDPLAAVGEALRVEPGLVAGHCLRAALLVMACREDATQELARTLVAAHALIGHADERERRHLAAAEAWLAQDMRRALRLYGEIAADYPHDTLALKVAHFGDFTWGEAERMRERTARALRHWNERMHGHDHVLAMHAFALVECGDCEQAERAARRALAIDPGNASALHALAHVMEMQGRSAEAIAWLRSCEPAWARNAGFAAHLRWHQALFHLEQDDIASALRLHDEHLRPHADSPASILVDASALLWRLRLRDVDVAGRWQRLADGWERQTPSVLRPFSDAHAMLAFVAAGRRASALRLMTTLRESVGRARDLGRIVHEAALPVCEALVAFGEGRYHQACIHLEAVRHLTRHCGGSLAQCDLLHLTWLEAALRGKQDEMAHALIAERRARRPHSAFNRQLEARACVRRNPHSTR